MKADRVALVIALGITMTIGAIVAMRPGYSPDEEITFFAVEGIRQTAVPTLPSGLTYWRGPLYSYLSWLAGLVAGFSFETYRAVSVLLAGVAILATFGIATAVSRTCAAIAAILLALMPAFVAMSAYARFYSAFTCAVVAALWCLNRNRMAAFGVSAVLARSLQEMGVVLAAAPLAHWWIRRETTRPRLWNVALLSIALLAAHFVLVETQRAGIAGEAARAPGAWLGTPIPVLATAPILDIATAADWTILAAAAIVLTIALSWRQGALNVLATLACVTAAAVLSLGSIVIVCVLWLLLAPPEWRRALGVAVIAAIFGWLFWIALTWIRSDTLLTWQLAADLFVAGILSHTAGVSMLVLQTPITLAMGIAAVLLSARYGSVDAAVTVRLVALMLWLHVAAFGVFGVDMRVRFIAVLGPMAAILCSAALSYTIAAASRSGSPVLRRPVAAMVILAGTILVLVEQQRLVVPMLRPTADARWFAPWLPSPGLSTIDLAVASHVKPGDIVVTNDELAGLLHGIKPSYWWTRDEVSAALYGKRDSAGALRSIYAGSPALFDADVQRLIASTSNGAGVSIVWFSSGKYGDLPDDFATLHKEFVDPVRVQTGDWKLIRFSTTRENRR